MLIVRQISQSPIRCAGACPNKGNGHVRCPGNRTCHCCDGNTGNCDGGGARLKAGTALVVSGVSRRTQGLTEFLARPRFACELLQPPPRGIASAVYRPCL